MNNLLHLLQLCDPALPIGGYAHSGGLETCVQQGLVHNPATARDFIEQMLSTNIHYTDAALLSLAHQNPARIPELDRLAEAVKFPKEIRESSRLLGRRLLAVFSQIAPPRPDLHYCIAFGWVAGKLNIDLPAALSGFYYNAAATMVTNCVKLIPIGQKDGQQILFGLHPLIRSLVAAGLQPDEDLIGLCNANLDIRSMQHEQLYSRLYMS